MNEQTKAYPKNSYNSKAEKSLMVFIKEDTCYMAARRV